MAKVTKEVMKSLIDADVYPPRHQRGCPKNYLRMLPLQGAAKGETIEQIKSRIAEMDKELPCRCK